MWTPRHDANKKISFKQLASPQHMLPCSQPTSPSFINLSTPNLLHIKNADSQLISPRQKLKTEVSMTDKQLKSSKSYKRFEQHFYQATSTNLDSNQRFNYERENELLKEYIQKLSYQIYQLRNHSFTNKQIQDSIIAELYKKFNLKLSIKNTLISQIKNIVMELKMDPNLTINLKNKLDQILQIILQNDTNILIKQTTFNSQIKSSNQVIIVYREDGGQGWRPFKNQKSQVKKQFKQQIQNNQSNQFYYQINKKYEQSINDLQIELKNIRTQLDNYKIIKTQNQQRIRKLELQKQQLKSNYRQNNSLSQQLISIQGKLQEYQKTQTIIEKQRASIQNERRKYKQTVKTLENKLLYTSIQLQTLELLKERLSQYQNLINHQKNQIILLNQQTKNKANQIIYQSQKVNSSKQSQQLTQYTKQSQTINFETNQFNHKNHEDETKIQYLQAQLKLKDNEIIKLKEKLNIAQNFNNQLKLIPINPQIGNQISNNIQILHSDINNHPLYIQKVEKLIEIQEALKKAEQYINFCESQKIQYINLIQLEHIQKQKIKNQLLVLNQKSQLTKQQYHNEQDQYFRYKADIRYKDAQIKLFELRNYYTKQADITKQLMIKYQTQQNNSHQKVLQMIRDTFNVMKNFDQTIIIEKSKLKKFNKNKLGDLLTNISKIKADNNQLKQDVQKIFSQDFHEIQQQIKKKLQQ